VFQFKRGENSGMNLAKYADFFAVSNNIGSPAIDKRVVF
jgi:hypothetical protein